MSDQTPGPPPGDDTATQPVGPYGQAPTAPQPAYAPPPAYPPPYGAQGPYGYGYPQPPGYSTPPFGGYPQPTPTPGSTIALVVVSGIFTVSGFFGIPSLILGIIALTKVNTNLAETHRLTRIGWIVFGVCAALALVAAVVLIGLLFTAVSHDTVYSTVDTLRAPGTTRQPAMLSSM